MLIRLSKQDIGSTLEFRAHECRLEVDLRVLQALRRGREVGHGARDTVLPSLARGLLQDTQRNSNIGLVRPHFRPLPLPQISPLGSLPRCREATVRPLARLSQRSFHRLLPGSLLLAQNT